MNTHLIIFTVIKIIKILISLIKINWSLQDN